MIKFFRLVVAVLMAALMGTVCYAETKDVTTALKSEAKQAVASEKVNLNTASQAELEKLPGIGSVTAKKIIAGRPYSTTGDLAKVGIPAKTISKITPQVVVGPVPANVKPMAPKPALPSVAPKVPNAPKTPTVAYPAKNYKPAIPPPVGKDMVWVNKESKIYHKPGDKWYGNTKKGSYMTESEAIKAGNRAAK
jgi:hypothetical protein